MKYVIIIQLCCIVQNVTKHTHTHIHMRIVHHSYMILKQIRISDAGNCLQHHTKTVHNKNGNKKERERERGCVFINKRNTHNKPYSVGMKWVGGGWVSVVVSLRCFLRPCHLNAGGSAGGGLMLKYPTKENG